MNQEKAFEEARRNQLIYEFKENIRWVLDDEKQRKIISDSIESQKTWELKQSQYNSNLI